MQLLRIVVLAIIFFAIIGASCMDNSLVHAQACNPSDPRSIPKFVDELPIMPTLQPSANTFDESLDPFLSTAGHPVYYYWGNSTVQCQSIRCVWCAPHTECTRVSLERHLCTPTMESTLVPLYKCNVYTLFE